MAVAFDAVGPSSSGTTGASSPLTWTHVCGASATHLLVGATWDGSPDGSGTLSASYNGVAMTSLGVWHTGSGTAGFLQVWFMANPPSGSHTVSITAGGSPLGINGGSVSFTGSGGLSAVQTFVPSGNSTNPSLTFTGSIAGNMVAAFVGGGSPQTPSGSFTSRYNENTGSGQQGAGYTACSTIASPGGSTTASWTAASDFYAIAAVEVQAAVVNDFAPGAWREPWQPAMARTFGPGRPFAQRPVILDPAPSLTVNAGVAAASAVAPAAAAPLRWITGLGGTGAGYFADQGGNPRMVLGDAVWGLPGNGGRWSSGAWQSDFDTYFATRAAQGFTVAYTKPMGTTQNAGINDDGRTFDGLFPFQGGTPSTGVSFANPSSGLTSAYWARIDYFLNSAKAQGITVFLNAIGYDSDFETSGPLSGKSASEFQSYGAALGARYANQTNLIWMVADDYFGSSDTKISSFLTGLRGAGANQPISIENFPESDSRQDVTSGSATAWGASNAQYNFCYSYNVTYFAVEKAYLEASPITVITGDGYFYQGGSSYAGGSGAFAYDRAIRQDAWHAISSGARGVIHGDEGCWQWASTAQTQASTAWYHSNNAGHIRTLMESLPNWHKLVPDTSSALVTAGRGTHATGFTSGGGGGQYEVAFTDSYVTASRTPDGGSGSDLAVIYLSHATSITIDQSKMVAGYQAFWVDPITGVKTQTTAGSTYNSATPGNNSQGDPDWVLVLQAPSAAGSPAAGVAPSSAVAAQPVVAVTVNAGVASASASAVAPLTAHTATSGVSTGLATAPGPSSALTATSGVATSSALGAPPVPAAGAKPPAAASSATALTASDTGNPSAGVASSSATAIGPVPAVTVNAGVAAASATALQPAVNTSGSTNAPAGVAASTVSALAPSTAVTLAGGVAQSSAVAVQPVVNTSSQTNANAGVAAATASAMTARISSAAQPAAPASLAAAAAPAAAAGSLAGIAQSTGSGTPAVVGRFAQAAASSALAMRPVIAVTITSGVATASAAAAGGHVPKQIVPGTVSVPVLKVATAIAGIAGRASAVGRSSDA